MKNFFYNEKTVALKKPQTAGIVYMWQSIKVSCISQFHPLKFHTVKEKLTRFLGYLLRFFCNEPKCKRNTEA